MSCGSAVALRRSAASSVASTSAAIPPKPSLPVEEGRDRDLVGGIEDGRRRAAGLERAAAERQRRKALRVGRLEGQRGRSWRDRAAPPARRSGSGQARQWAIGMRMSGEPSCAITEPSRNSTRPWTIDCGCTSTSSCVRLEREQMMRLDQFEALVHHGRGIDGDLRAHRPVRMLERLLERRGAHRFAASRCGTGRPRRSG